MRALFLLFGAIALASGAIVATTNVFRPAPAADRLSGVSVRVASYSIDNLPGDTDRLHLQVVVTSLSDLGECLGFTLDEPFAGRRVDALTGTCIQPRRRPQTVALVYSHLTADDQIFPSHTLVWGIPGGRCGIILELFGVCVVEQAGTADFDLPSKTVLPSWPPFGSFKPLFPEASFSLSY
jgi:hypothetical protein